MATPENVRLGEAEIIAAIKSHSSYSHLVGNRAKHIADTALRNLNAAGIILIDQEADDDDDE